MSGGADIPRIMPESLASLPLIPTESENAAVEQYSIESLINCQTINDRPPAPLTEGLKAARRFKRLA